MRKIRHPQLDDVDLTEVMRALADPARVAIVQCLIQSRGPLTCGEITGDRPKSSMSHHFKILRDAGVIETRASGKEHLNALRTADLDRRFPGLMKVLVRLLVAEASPVRRTRRASR